MGAPDGSCLERFTLDGQTVILEDLRGWQPGLRAQIFEPIKERQLEIGPWCTMPDLYLPTPDALPALRARARPAFGPLVDETATEPTVQIVDLPSSGGRASTFARIGGEL
jgi:hypothetical protein